MEKYYFIINPLASSGKSTVVWRDCKAYLEKKEIKHEVYMTSYIGQAQEIASRLTSGEEQEKEKTIIVIGGDGTFGEVVNGINISAKVTLACIAGGSGNDFVKGNRLAVSSVKRLKQILKKKHVCWIDYGVLSYIRGELHQRRFLVSSGMGLDAAICEGVQISPLKRISNKLHMGRFVYIGVGLATIFKEKPVNLQLTLDGGQTMNLEHVRYISFHILPREGGGFYMAPEADNQDGLLDLCIVSCKKRFKLIGVLLAALFGKHKNMKEVHIVKCTSAAIRADEKVCVHTDGEISGHLKEFSVLCEKRKIKTIL